MQWLKDGRGKRTLGQVARRSGLNKSTHKRVEDGEMEPDPWVLAMIIDSYAIDESTAVERLADWIRWKWFRGRGRRRQMIGAARELLRAVREE